MNSLQVLKVADFGLASNEPILTGVVGSDGYIAPECYTQPEYSNW